MLNILSVWPESLLRRKQSPSRRFVLYALAERPDVNHHVTGPGFPDWNNDASGWSNVQRIMPDCHAVIGYKLAGCEYGAVNNPQELSQHVLTMEAYNEVRDDMYPGGMHPAGDCRKAGTRVVILHHSNDAPAMQSVADYGARLVVLPHCAGPVFLEESRPWSERQGVVLTGTISATYPLRMRWADLIKRGKIPGAIYQRPPNYTNSVEESDALVREYARVLGSCRVKLGCTSAYRYLLQHISEAALAGCAHVCDVPFGETDTKQMVYTVQCDATDAQLVEAVEYAMEHAEEMGTWAQRLAMEHFTTARYAERLVGTIREELSRG